MRKSFSKSQCEEILENQDGNCKICGVRFFGKNKVRPQYDHINGDHSDNRVANGQAICANCHDVKSRKQNVQRSIQEQDINFVKRCPLCNHKTRWKDYDLKNEPMTEENRKIISNSEYMMAGWPFLCYDCKSILKVIRVDSKKPRKSTGKKYEDVVKYCTSCGGKWADPSPSNTTINCGNCKSSFSVWIKEYKKRSSWHN